MYKFVLIQGLIKCLIVIQNIWFAKVLNNEVSDLFIVLSTLIAVGLIIDLNSNTEINRLDNDFDKVKIFSFFVQIKAILGIFVSVLVYAYFRYYLKLDLFKSLISFSIPFDSISGLVLVKYLAVHEFKKYHFFTFFISSLKILTPISTFVLFDSIEIGILFSSIIGMVVLSFSSGYRKVHFQLLDVKFFTSIFSIGFILNLVQKADVFLIARSNFSWKDDFFIYNRFYEFLLFPISLLIGYLYKNLDLTVFHKNLITKHQFLVAFLLAFLGLVSFIMNQNLLLLIFIFKYILILLGMFFLPIYSKYSNYSRTVLFFYLSLVFFIRILIPFLFDLGLFLLLITEVGVFIVLFKLAISNNSFFKS